MTVGEDEYPPPLPRHRRISEPPSVLDDYEEALAGDLGSTGLGSGDNAPSELGSDELGTGPWFDAPDNRLVSEPPVAEVDSDPILRPRQPAIQSRSRNGLDLSNINLDSLRNGPLPMVGAVVALVLAAGLLGWLFNGSGSNDEVTIGGSEADGAAIQDSDVGADTLAPLSPATLPTANEPGLVAMELPLIDVYTGTGSSGSVQLYLNSITGQVCHQFNADAMDGRYRAYVHEAMFPREGPVIVDLGEVENAVPRCVNSNPIDLTRALTQADGFYVAAHSADQDFVLRGQMSDAEMAFDNRDPATVAEQQAAATTETTIGDGSAEDLFGASDEGAFLLVDAGQVTFEGMVPDQGTADRLRAAFVPLAGMGVEVIDNLTLQAGSPPPSGKVIVADALLFGSGQDRIDGDPQVLATLADLMTVNPLWTMTITGHTDDVGEWLYNIELSLRRANNVRARLSELGIPAERIRVQGAGPEQPIAENDSDEGRAANRRIEISIDS